MRSLGVAHYSRFTEKYLNLSGPSSPEYDLGARLPMEAAGASEFANSWNLPGIILPCCGSHLNEERVYRRYGILCASDPMMRNTVKEDRR